MASTRRGGYARKGSWMVARRWSVALQFAADRVEGNITQIDVAATLQPERHEHVPFDRLRITGAHHPDRADRQGRSRPVRRHVSPARRWLGDCLAPAGGGASATTAAGGVPQHRTCPARSVVRRTGRTHTYRGAAGASSLGDRGARGVVREHPSVLAGWNHPGAQRVHFATTDAGLAAFPGCESVATRDHG